MVDEEIFSRRLDALEGYLAQAERLGEVDEDAFLAEPAVHDLAERDLRALRAWAVSQLDSSA